MNYEVLYTPLSTHSTMCGNIFICLPCVALVICKLLLSECYNSGSNVSLSLCL